MGLPLKTQMEMIRGAHARLDKKNFDPDTQARVDNVIKAYEGQLILQSLRADRKYDISVTMSEDHTLISVEVTGPGLAKTEFSEPREDFPSETLRAQIALLCG